MTNQRKTKPEPDKQATIPLDDGVAPTSSYVVTPEGPIDVSPLKVKSSGSLLDVDPSLFKSTIDNREKNRKALHDLIDDVFEDDIDFGVLRRKDGSAYTKPCLFKPGAEKVCQWLGLRPRFPELAQWETLAMKTDMRAVTTITLRCELVDGRDDVHAEGVGARNVQSDAHDLNKSMKMAAKNAMIDAVLRVAGLSGKFTQDQDNEQITITGPLSETECAYLHDTASELFDDGPAVLESLAARRFNLDDWKQIPAARLSYCISALKRKAETEGKNDD